MGERSGLGICYLIDIFLSMYIFIYLTNILDPSGARMGPQKGDFRVRRGLRNKKHLRKNTSGERPVDKNKKRHVLSLISVQFRFLSERPKEVGVTNCGNKVTLSTTVQGLLYDIKKITNADGDTLEG